MHYVRASNLGGEYAHEPTPSARRQETEVGRPTWRRSQRLGWRRRAHLNEAGSGCEPRRVVQARHGVWTSRLQPALQCRASRRRDDLMEGWKARRTQYKLSETSNKSECLLIWLVYRDDARAIGAMKRMHKLGPAVAVLETRLKPHHGNRTMRTGGQLRLFRLRMLIVSTL